MTPLRLQSTDAFIRSISWVMCALHVIIPVEELTCEELEAQRGERTCPRSHSWEVEELGLELMLLINTTASSHLGQEGGSTP